MKNQTIQKIEEKAPAFNIETLINRAVEQNLSVESLERILALRKTLKDEWAKSEYDKALAAFQGECPIVERTKQGAFSKYAPVEVIAEQIKPYLAKNGLSYTFDTEEVENKIITYCTVTHIAGHTGKPSKAIVAKETMTKMNSSQQSGSVMTYGKRYSLMNALAIMVRDEDDDAGNKKDVSTHQNIPSNNAIQKEEPKIAKDTCPECHAPAGKLHASKCSLNK